MIPTFSDDRKRKINLGGVLPVITHAAAIIDRVREPRGALAYEYRRGGEGSERLDIQR